ncbi:MAG: hypothetical protein FWE95_09250 [Planctomycetaceae bacterium]|nr:hypothetical protein [Planctomycetaceae bacterium]
MDRRHFLFLLAATAGVVGCRNSVPEGQTPEAGSEGTGSAAFGYDPNKPLLRYRFKKGEELRWNVLNTLHMKNIIGGMEENIETSTRSVKIWKTLDVDADGAATFEYRVEDLDTRKAQTGHHDVTYNSRRDTVIPPAFTDLAEKIGVPLAQIRIDPQGRTTKRPLREYHGALSENRIVIPLPDEPVEVGSSWSGPSQIDLPQPNQTVKKIRIRHEFSLESIHSGLATIKFATIPLTPLSPKEEMQLFDYFTVGTMKLDLDTGHFIWQQSTIDKLVVGVREASDSIRYLTRVTECCCGLKACEICHVSGR